MRVERHPTLTDGPVADRLVPHLLSVGLAVLCVGTLVGSLASTSDLIRLASARSRR
jgi:hypothetical protein